VFLSQYINNVVLGKVVLLLCERVKKERMGLWKKEITEESKKQLWLAGPMIFVCVFQFSLQLISLMFVGHLNELFLASVSLSTSIVNATGYNVMVSFHHFFSVILYQLVAEATLISDFYMHMSYMELFFLSHHFSLQCILSLLSFHVFIFVVFSRYIIDDGYSF